jgi:hypothetical protein
MSGKLKRASERRLEREKSSRGRQGESFHSSSVETVAVAISWAMIAQASRVDDDARDRSRRRRRHHPPLGLGELHVAQQQRLMGGRQRGDDEAQG